MPPYDLVRSILMRARMPNPYEPGAPEALPDPGPPVPPLFTPEVYDPVFAAYVDASPAYEPPAPWFEGVPIAGTPMPVRHIEPAEALEPAPVQMDYEAMNRGLFEQLMRLAADHVGMPDVPPVAYDAPAPAYGPVPEAAPAAEPQPIEIDGAALTEAMFDHQLQLLSEAMAMHGPDQPAHPMPLEQIVEQEFQQMMDPFGMAGPPDMMGPGMGPIM
jgi:hypothetical protein